MTSEGKVSPEEFRAAMDRYLPIEEQPEPEWQRPLTRSKITPEVRLKQQQYLERVRATVREVRVLLPDEALDETFERVWEAVDANEAPEGLQTLAWTVAQADIPIPTALAEAIYDQSKYFIRRDEMPRKFRTVEEEEAAQKLGLQYDVRQNDPRADPTVLKYLNVVRQTMWEFMCLFPGEDFQPVWKLVEHGEPARGLFDVAWMVATADVPLPATLAEALYELTAGLIPRDEMPDELRTELKSQVGFGYPPGSSTWTPFTPFYQDSQKSSG